ncbi:MAG: N-acetylmuramoyl-L-alanine amidase [Cyanobacteria bacterium REEB67]|nr:N-acetylmuramoyl-L-alanine amidase [Cyanobacteria bacterium REEB67]
MPIKPRLTFVDRPSPNFNERKGVTPQILVLHYTAMATAEAAIQRLCDPAAQVSSHYVIDEQGVIYRLVAEDKRAWHAGVSYWDGKTDLNTSSIGIEIANPGDVPFAKAQMDAVTALCRDIVKRYKMRAIYVVAHSDIAPDRKQDPGELFDWQGLAANGVGIFPSPNAGDYKTAATWDAAAVQSNLARLGYRSGIDLAVLVTAFQRRFHQDVFKTPASVGIADHETKARLANLVRRKAIADGLRARTKS